MTLRPRLLGYFLALIALLVITTSAVSAQTRIHFARGATRATALGYLRGIRDERYFVLRLNSGQRVRVEIKGHGPTRGVLIFPSGKQDGGPGGVIYDEPIDETGDYRIRVTESSMAEAWRGRFTVVVDALSNNSTSSPNSNSADLTRYVGQYPTDLFEGVPSLKPRLRTLLGANYKSFFDRLEVQMPIENDGGALVVRGCMPHLCTIDEAILVISQDSKLYVAIKSSRHGDGFKTFSADRGRVNEALRRAMQK
jgi:hypothetical protein